MDNFDVVDVGSDDGTLMLKRTHNDGSVSTFTVPKELVSKEHQ